MMLLLIYLGYTDSLSWQQGLLAVQSDELPVSGKTFGRRWNRFASVVELLKKVLFLSRILLMGIQMHCFEQQPNLHSNSTLMRLE
ncbi:hypothetical protein L228DRAFT_250233, partial [Xylona heveae TC161]